MRPVRTRGWDSCPPEAHTPPAVPLSSLPAQRHGTAAQRGCRAAAAAHAGALLVGGVHEDAAVQQGAVHVGHHGAHIPEPSGGARERLVTAAASERIVHACAGAPAGGGSGGGWPSAPRLGAPQAVGLAVVVLAALAVLHVPAKRVCGAGHLRGCRNTRARASVVSPTPATLQLLFAAAPPSHPHPLRWGSTHLVVAASQLAALPSLME